MSTATLRRPSHFASPPAKRDWLPVSDLQFPGCEAHPMTVAEYEAHDGWVECYDSESGLAWIVCEPVGFAHATASSKLDRLANGIAQARGAPISCHGRAELRLLDTGSGEFRSMQPDQFLYLRQDFEDPRNGPFLAVGEGPYPEVALEVDDTTDVRGNKLKLYEEWKFPELWVEVPNATSPNRPGGSRPGLDIHLLQEGRFVRSAVSRAFPGWRATEIHRALNERVVSAETGAVLYRVGRALGELEGTGPEDNLWLRRFLDLGRAEGHAKGHAEGRIEGRAETVATVARELLRRRGIELATRFPADLGPSDRAALRRALPETVVAAAAAAGSLADFLARLRAPGA